jgi:hypothetical protein
MQHARSLNGSPSFDSIFMNRENLATYLNDHLAGSVAALGLLDHLVETTGGTRHEAFFRDLRVEVAADQDVLRTLLEKLSAPESTLRKAGAWLMEKAARAKLRVDGSAGSAMERLEALEALLLGITGKRALWLALAASVAPLENVDFAMLIGRAEQQIETVEAKRIEAAREAIGDGR